MATYALRVWLPDRPGALGLVAGAIGRAGGDVAAIEVLERGAGRAVDELLVELEQASVDDLVGQVQAVEGVDVEDIVEVSDTQVEADLVMLEQAADFLQSSDRALVIDSVIDNVMVGIRAEWAAAIVQGTGLVGASRGEGPTAQWLAAFVAGGHSAVEAGISIEPDDLCLAFLPSVDVAIVFGRQRPPFRRRERRRVEAIAVLADKWLEQFVPHCDNCG